MSKTRRLSQAQLRAYGDTAGTGSYWRDPRGPAPTNGAGLPADQPGVPIARIKQDNRLNWQTAPHSFTKTGEKIPTAMEIYDPSMEPQYGSTVIIKEIDRRPLTQDRQDSSRSRRPSSVSRHPDSAQGGQERNERPPSRIRHSDSADSKGNITGAGRVPSASGSAPKPTTPMIQAAQPVISKPETPMPRPVTPLMPQTPKFDDLASRRRSRLSSSWSRSERRIEPFRPAMPEGYSYSNEDDNLAFYSWVTNGRDNDMKRSRLLLFKMP